jgi:hypothetical protein
MLTAMKVSNTNTFGRLASSKLVALMGSQKHSDKFAVALPPK